MLVYWKSQVWKFMSWDFIGQGMTVYYSFFEHFIRVTFCDHTLLATLCISLLLPVFA